MRKTIIDHTRRKNEITAKHLLRCPKCGRIGEERRYTAGDVMYIHKKELNEVFLHWDVTDSCFIPKK